MCETTTTTPVRVISIPANNVQMPIWAYVKMINSVKASPKGTKYKQSLCGWWPATREEILAQNFQMVQDRINRHLTVRTLTGARLRRLKAKHLKSECRWCGQSLGEYKEREQRFCPAPDSCRRDYYS